MQTVKQTVAIAKENLSHAVRALLLREPAHDATRTSVPATKG